jgi:hypothetical protein
MSSENLEKECQPLDPIEFIGNEVLSIERQMLRREFQHETAQSVASKLVGARVGAALVGAMIPIGLPMAAIFAGIAGYRTLGKQRDDLSPSAESVEYVEKIDKKIKKNTLERLRSKFKNVHILNPKPTTKVSSAQHMHGRVETNPIQISSAELLAERLRIYAEKHGCSSDEAIEIATVASSFAQSEMREEFSVLQAARSLRGEFHLTPKPPVKWAQRKAEGKDITLANALGEYKPELKYRETNLADLTAQQWWEAFYEEDANAGRINDSYLQEFDRAFHTKFKRDHGLRSFSTIIGRANIEGRASCMADILGTRSASAAQKFIIPGAASMGRGRPDNSSTRTA